MNKQSVSRFGFGAIFLALAAVHSYGQDPTVDPNGDAGALKPKVETGSGYDPHSGNASRSITDLQVPGAVGAYGLDFARHWNSVGASADASGLPSAFAYGGWTHSWEWTVGSSMSVSFCDPENNPTCGDVTTTVTHIRQITFADGRTARFSFTRTDAGGANPYLGPPYPANWDGEMGGWGVHDHLAGMDPDGNQFWLYMADGGSVHFEKVAGSYRATQIIDPHGLSTTLQYDATAYLSSVTDAAGRSLRIYWATIGSSPYPSLKVIQAVESGAGSSLQRVEYGYSPYSTEGYYWHALTQVSYVNDLDLGGQPIKANYTYTPWVSHDPQYSGIIRGRGPVLTTADDPRFEGAMNKIRYVFRGGPNGGTPFCPKSQENPQGTGYNPLVYYHVKAFPVEKEIEPDTGLVVSQLSIPCNIDAAVGTRLETTALAGSRTFAYGFKGGTDSAGLNGAGFELTRVADFVGGSEFQSYWMGEPKRSIDARGTVTEFTPVGNPDGSGRVKEVWHSGSDNSKRLYNWTSPGSSAARDTVHLPNTYNHWLFSQTDERNLTTTYTRDSLRRVTRIDYPGGTYETFVYNAFNQVTERRLASGAIQYCLYDARGLKTDEWSSAYPTEVTKFYYDAFDRLERVKDPRAVTLGLDYSVKFIYNVRHQVIEAHYPATGGLADPKVVYKYDDRGNCISTKNELGFESTYTYDNYRRCTSYTEPLDAPAWNGAGTVATRTWNWTYDRSFPPSYTVSADSYTHTSNKWRFQIEPAFNAAGERRLTVREYDLENQLKVEQTGWIRKTDGTNYYGPDGESHSFTYDANGNKISHTDPLNRVTTYQYDLRDRLIKTTEPLSRITTIAYDTTGNKTLVTFPDSKTQQWLDYDAFGQPGRFIDERSNTTNLAYQWGPMKKLLTVTTHRDKDAGGTEDQVTTFSYDGIGQPTQTLFPDGSTEVTHYALGQVDSFKTRKNATKTINSLTQRDARGRELSHTWSDGTPGVTRTWDDANRVISLANSNSIIAYTYDNAGQVRTEIDNVTGALGTALMTYWRYANGDVAHVTYPNGFVLRRDYTARGQLAATGWDVAGTWVQKLTQYNYLADGKVNYEDSGNGVRTSFSYDGRGFMTGTNSSKLSPAQVYSNRTYGRDTRDRIFWWKKSNTPANNPMENGRGDRYTYDNEGQLTAASYQALTPDTTPTGAQRTDSFVYDQLGNRKGANQVASLGAVTMHRRDNGLNQYLDWTQWWINYESNGNLYQDGWLTASFNALNQNTGIWSSRVTPTGDWVNSAYDPLGRCVTRWTPLATTYFYYDGWNLIQEGSNAVTADRIYAHGNRVDEIVASQAGGVWAYHHYDARGHCILLTNASGGLLEQYDYDAFGKPYFYNATGVLQTSSGWGNKFLFTGREWLKEVAVYDFRNRHYLPELGRFMQPDPKQFDAGDYNLYRYCHNDPINRSDPLGLELTLDMFSDQSTFIRRALDRIPTLNETFSVGAHGSPRSMADDRGMRKDFTGSNVGARGLSKIIQQNPQFAQAEEVVLYSCSTGQGNNSLAQQLADRLDRPVWAPDNLVWVNKNGITFVGPRLSDQKFLPNGKQNPNYSKPDRSKPGMYHLFRPRRKD